jgi:DNA-binding protein YbaB
MKKMPGGLPNMGNMNNMIKQARSFSRTDERQQELAQKEFEVSAGGGAVTIQITDRTDYGA